MVTVILSLMMQNGDELWKVNTYTSIIAPPITYSVGGEQYVAIQVGSVVPPV